jgi:hypothetical protein
LRTQLRKCSETAHYLLAKVSSASYQTATDLPRREILQLLVGVSERLIHCPVLLVLHVFEVALQSAGKSIREAITHITLRRSIITFTVAFKVTKKKKASPLAWGRRRRSTSSRRQQPPSRAARGRQWPRRPGVARWCPSAATHRGSPRPPRKRGVLPHPRLLPPLGPRVGRRRACVTPRGRRW